MEQTGFDRYVAQQRLYNQAEALRLASDRMNIMAQFQAARLGMNRKSRLGWVIKVLRIFIVKIFQYVRRTLP